MDLSRFQPARSPRPANRPLTIINTGTLSLRKGTPYLLEAFRLIHRSEPTVRFLLTRAVADSAREIVARYRDLPIDWAEPLPHDQLAHRLRSADLFILPSLEEGLVRTALEAMACGLPVILTPNTGTSDYVEPGVNGSVVPIRDPQAIHAAVLTWWGNIQSGYQVPATGFQARVSVAHLAQTFRAHLVRLGYLASTEAQPPRPG